MSRLTYWLILFLTHDSDKCLHAHLHRMSLSVFPMFFMSCLQFCISVDNMETYLDLNQAQREYFSLVSMCALFQRNCLYFVQLLVEFEVIEH